MIDVSSFLARFPEFERIAEETLDATIANALVEFDNYRRSLDSEVDKDYATSLYVAFLLESQYPANSATGMGVVKRMKNFNDEVEFAVNSINQYSWESNQYGVRLTMFLASKYDGGIYV